MRLSRLTASIALALLGAATCAPDRATDTDTTERDAGDCAAAQAADSPASPEGSAAGEAHPTDRFSATQRGPNGDAPPWPWELADQGEDVPGTVPLEEIRPGGPPPDGIPPIDDPQFESVADAAAWLEPADPLLVTEFAGEVRAYPLAILTFHEVVNDTVAGGALLVTYCPLCNSGLVFERTLQGEELTFGTSGRLWKSNLVMYDRGTRSLWSQFTGEAIVGERTGDELERVPMQMLSLQQVCEQWPDADVLSRDTGHERDYGRNPYVGYEDGDPFAFDGDTEGPLEQMARVVAAGGEADPVAYPWERLEDERLVHDDIDGQPAVVLWAPGAASALDAEDISEGADVGQAGVFVAEAGGQRLTFEAARDGEFVDEQTGSTWRVTGEAVDGPLEGSRLERLSHDDTFWFVQHAFRPDTRVEDGRP